MLFVDRISTNKDFVSNIGFVGFELLYFMDYPYWMKYKKYKSILMIKILPKKYCFCVSQHNRKETARVSGFTEALKGWSSTQDLE